MRRRGVVLRWGSSLVSSALLATLLVLSGSDAGTDRPLDAPLDPSAGSTYLCSGYKGCRSAGYSDAGYGAVNDRMYWRMYTGHNCTNYAAYRVIKDGGPATRPWSGGGNASEWGLHMKHITDQVPNVGAIAWWGRYSNGSGSAGHVAYVERVISSTEIIVSEDSWGGTFHWRRITKSSGRWPTGFIHFVDKAIRAKAKPVITGTPEVGTPLTVSTGAWSVAPTSYAYQWFSDGVPVAGATGSSYTPTATDVRRVISARVTARRSGYTAASQLTLATAAVEKGTFVLTQQPVVTGTPYVDEVLTASTGTWTPTNERPGWRWYADDDLIAVRDTPTLSLAPGLVGKTISVIAVARAHDGFRNTQAPRVEVGEVLLGSVEVTTPFAVKGRHKVGETLSVRRGAYSPADATPRYQWLRDGAPIAGATAATYTLTPADARREISAQVALTRAHYASRSQAVAARRPIKTVSDVRTRTIGRDGKAIVRARVVAPGVSAVPGKVFIRIGRWTDTVRLVDGRARVVARLPAGRKDVVVKYLGSTQGEWTVISRAREDGSVRVD